MNIRQHKFVTEYLRWGDQVIAYKNAYNATSNYKTLESAANRLLRDPEVAQTIREAQTRIRESVEKEVAEQQKGQLLTIQKKRELLHQIATGEMHVLQYYKGKDCNTCTQYVTPTINHMLRAIHLDNKLAGHYAPVAHPANGSSIAKEHLPRQVGMKQSHENMEKSAPQEIQKHEKSQQFTTKPPLPESLSRHRREVGPITSEINHENAQQFTTNDSLFESAGQIKRQNEPVENPTNLSPAGGGGRRSGVERLAPEPNHENAQHNTTKQPRILTIKRRKQLQLE